MGKPYKCPDCGEMVSTVGQCCTDGSGNPKPPSLGQVTIVPAVTTERLANLLIKHGLIEEDAYTDPDGYDHGCTVAAIERVASEL